MVHYLALSHPEDTWLTHHVPSDSIAELSAHRCFMIIHQKSIRDLYDFNTFDFSYSRQLEEEQNQCEEERVREEERQLCEEERRLREE
jgi:hypothetical protein